MLVYVCSRLVSFVAFSSNVFFCYSFINHKHKIINVSVLVQDECWALEGWGSYAPLELDATCQLRCRRPERVVVQAAWRVVVVREKGHRAVVPQVVPSSGGSAIQARGVM